MSEGKHGQGGPPPCRDSPRATGIKLALDLGTTTLAGRLLRPDGEILVEHHVANPQRELGADILLRLQRAEAGAGVLLQTLLVDGLRSLVEQLLAGAGISPGKVAAVAAAGNPGISCLLRNLPVSALLAPPHRPPFKNLVCIPAAEIDLGLAVPLELFPPVSGFVGGDLTAVLFGVEDLACGVGAVSLHRISDKPGVPPGTMLIDIGTNAELALWDGSRWWVTSAAAGPAFEGGNIAAGMVMAAGAVIDVRLEEDVLRLSVSEGGAPRGLCGSGLTALVAAARTGGVIDAGGRILSANEVATNLGRYLVAHAGAWAIRFHHSAAGALLLTQQDVRNFQLAKGAVRAGVETLLERCGLVADSVPQLLVTGALGTALPVETLKRVALLPEPMLDKTSFVANGVLAGLQAYLGAPDGRQRLESLLPRMQSLPLSGTPTFEKHFLASLEF